MIPTGRKPTFAYAAIAGWLSAAGSIVSRWWPRSWISHVATVRTASDPSPRPWAASMRTTSIPAWRYCRSVSSCAWIRPTTRPSASIAHTATSSACAARSLASPSGSAACHRAWTVGSRRIALKVAASLGSAGRSRTDLPARGTALTERGPDRSPPADAALEVVGHLGQVAREGAGAQVLPAAIRQERDDRPGRHPARLPRGRDEDGSAGRPAEDPLAIDEVAERDDRVGVADEVLHVQ